MSSWIERDRDEVQVALMAVAAFFITGAIFLSVTVLATAITLAMDWLVATLSG